MVDNIQNNIPPQKELTKPQKKFVALFKGNIREASKKAGISYSYGKRLCTKVDYKHVQDAIDDRMEEFSKNCGIDLEWLLTRLIKLTDWEMSDFYDENWNIKPLDQLPDRAKYSVMGLDVKRKTVVSDLDENLSVETILKKFKLPDKTKVINLIAEILKFKNRGLLDELDGEDVKEINVKFVRKGDVVESRS